MQISCEKETELTEAIIGRKLLDVSYFFSRLQEISNHGPLGCGFRELKLVGETLNGLQSKFTFKCTLCNLKFIIDSDICRDDYAPVNTCAVAGTIAIGCGYSQLEEFLSSINLPIISENIYIKNHDLVTQKWEDVLTQTMNEAADTERKLAKERKQGE